VEVEAMSWQLRPPSASPRESDSATYVEGRYVLGRVLEVLSVAEVAYPLVALGLMGVVCWLASPGMVWRGLAGAVLLSAGAAGLVALPVSAGGTFLLALAAASLCMEVLTTPGFGLHAAGGAVGLGLGGLSLQEPWSGAHPAIALSVAALVAGATYRAGCRSWRCTRHDPFAASPVLTGRTAVVLHADDHQGLAVVGGQLWTIHARHGRLREGQVVRVTQAMDARLEVVPNTAQTR
jgi:membrane-bound serine protease (ClpP class)